MTAVTVAIIAIGAAGIVALVVQFALASRRPGWLCVLCGRRPGRHALVLAVLLASLTASASDPRAPMHVAHHCRTETVGDTFRRDCEYRRGDLVIYTTYSRTTYRLP